MTLHKNYESWAASVSVETEQAPPTPLTPDEDTRAAVEAFGFHPDALTWKRESPYSHTPYGVLMVEGVEVRLLFEPCHIDGYKVAIVGFWKEIYTREELKEAIDAYVNKVKQDARPCVVRVEANSSHTFNAKVMPFIEDGYTIQHCFSTMRDGLYRGVYILTLDKKGE